MTLAAPQIVDDTSGFNAICSMAGPRKRVGLVYLHNYLVQRSLGHVVNAVVVAPVLYVAFGPDVLQDDFFLRLAECHNQQDLQVFRYRQALYEAQASDRPDLLRQWLDEGLEWLGTDDPVAILGKNPKRLISARREGLELVPIFRDLGLDDAANRML